MQIFHGSNVVVSRPELIARNRFLDFGSGFYTTTNRSQAVNFASKVTARRKEGRVVLSIYTVNEQKAFQECKTLLFNGPDESWLDFVALNRQGINPEGQYDLVYGPVANDDVYRTVALYMTGVLSKQQALEALKIKKMFDQLVFLTEKSLNYLRFERSELV